MAVFLLVGLIFLSQSILAYAQMSPNEFKGNESKGSISPQWDNVNDITLDLYFENGDACCTGKIRALSGTSKITAIFKLERKSSSGWVLEKSWGESSTTKSLSFFETDSVSSGYTYRICVTADVTRNGVTETVSTLVEGKY